MASTFSSALNLELQASGENSGTWGVITNNNLQKVESAIKGMYLLLLQAQPIHLLHQMDLPQTNKVTL
jgi:hypothetical protein